MSEKNRFIFEITQFRSAAFHPIVVCIRWLQRVIRVDPRSVAISLERNFCLLGRLVENRFGLPLSRRGSRNAPARGHYRQKLFEYTNNIILLMKHRRAFQNILHIPILADSCIDWNDVSIPRGIQSHSNRRSEGFSSVVRTSDTVSKKGRLLAFECSDMEYCICM
jgi:hypothetical protein